LRFAASVSAAWVILLVLRPFAAADELVVLMSTPAAVVLVLVHAALAALFWWGSRAPARRLAAVYTGLVAFAVRSGLGIYLVLYAMTDCPPGATMIVLVEMVLSLGLLAALVNGLPAVIRIAG
jgi:hypothetical protein